MHIHSLQIMSTSQVGSRQKRRKISQIQEFVHATVEPCISSYGMVPTTINAVTDSGDSVTIPLSDTTPSTSASRQPTDTAANTLFLLDRFGVSDEFYHELAQVYTQVYISAKKSESD